MKAPALRKPAPHHIHPDDARSVAYDAKTCPSIRCVPAQIALRGWTSTRCLMCQRTFSARRWSRSAGRWS